MWLCNNAVQTARQPLCRVVWTALLQSLDGVVIFPQSEAGKVCTPA